MNNIFKKNKVNDYIYVIKENEFKSDTPSLSLNNLFINKKITYTYKEYVIISKSSNPTIHFVIEHPKLVKAIENFNPLIKE